MSILFPYPVVDLDPPLQKVHTNYETIHWKGLAGQSAVGAMSGYFFYWLKASNQVTKKVPRYHVFGALAGMCLGTYNNHYTITNQFQGYFPNENLIKKYGSLSDHQIIEALKKEGESMKPINPFSLPPVLAPDEFSTSKEKKTVPNRYPMVSLFPTSNMIILNFEQWDYVRMFGCGLAFFINAILITSILMGMVTEYNTSHLRLIGLAPNELEVQKYGKLDEKKLMKEILMNKYPVVNFEEVNLEEVLFNEETLKLIELALRTKYPYTDLSNIVFENLAKHSSNQNQTIIELITKAGYPTSTYF